MSNYQTQFGSTTFNSAADADLLLRIGIALAARHRAAWRVVRVAAQNGIVRLEGIVPTFYDRQLILAVAQHVAGVLRVEDELAIDDPSPLVHQPAASTASTTTAPTITASATTEFVANVEAHGGTEVKQATPQNAFFHLPVLDESLEDILAQRAGNSAAAG